MTELLCFFEFQSPVDVVVGITDEQATEMAKNLEFKGPALLEVATVLCGHAFL